MACTDSHSKGEFYHIWASSWWSLGSRARGFQHSALLAVFIHLQCCLLQTEQLGIWGLARSLLPAGRNIRKFWHSLWKWDWKNDFVLGQTDFNKWKYSCFQEGSFSVLKLEMKNCFKMEKLKISHSTSLARGSCVSLSVPDTMLLWNDHDLLVFFLTHLTWWLCQSDFPELSHPFKSVSSLLLQAVQARRCGHHHHGYSLHRHDGASREVVHGRECTLCNFLAIGIFPKLTLESLSGSPGCTKLRVRSSNRA